MPVEIAATPNPNALKFTVGAPVGGPVTHARGAATDDPMVADLLEIDGVVSIFMTADFVTLTKSPEADWSTIAPDARRILESHFPDQG